MRFRPNTVSMVAGVPRRFAYSLLGRVPGGPMLASDSFDGRTLLGSTDGYWYDSGAGKAWVQVNGTWACENGLLRPTGSSPGGQSWQATIDPGVADAIGYEFNIAWVTSGTSNAFMFRVTDGTNYLRLACTSSSIAFQTVIAGSSLGVGTASTGVSPTLGDVVIGSINGNVMAAQVFRNGVAVGTPATLTNSTGAGSTPVGFRGATDIRIGYLKVWRLAA